MVDETRVLRLLRAASDELSLLRAEASSGPDRRADPVWPRDVIKYSFVTAIEACVDIGPARLRIEGMGTT